MIRCFSSTDRKNLLFLRGTKPFSLSIMVIDDQKTCRSGQKGGTRVDTFQSVKTKYHPEGIKGAEATASAIFMARKGSNKEDIRAYIVQEFGYDLSRTCDQIPDIHSSISAGTMALYFGKKQEAATAAS